jgi:drug/metabolite transporter (DMT)-like permease
MTTLLVYLMDFKSQSLGSTLGVFFITFGGIFAGIHDLTGSVFGYCVVFASVVMNAGQLVYSKTLSDKGYDSNYVFFYSSVLVFPMALVSNLTQELPIINLSSVLDTSQKLLSIFLGITASVLANFMTIYCSARVSPIATSVSGNFKDAFSMFLGLFLFQEPFTEYFFYGLLLSTTGAGLFSYSKLKSLSSKTFHKS